MAERRIVAALYVDEESILGKVAEIETLTTRLSHASLELKTMLTQRKTADLEQAQSQELTEKG